MSLWSGMVAGVRVARGVLGSLLGRGPSPFPQLTSKNFFGAFWERFNRAGRSEH
jgi:hypothetical protein